MASESRINPAIRHWVFGFLSSFVLRHSTFPMSLLTSEAGKRRLLSVELPVIERYNAGRDAEYQIQVVKHLGGLLLNYRLKPAHNVYELETRLYSTYPATPPE